MHLRANPLCVDCLKQGRTNPATDVDHIIPKSRGGTDDLDNLQSLCHAHHSQKTNRERQGHDVTGNRPRITIVTGPPGAGKTTFVREQRAWGDLVVDVDALYAALSGLDWYEKPEGLLPFVLAARDAVLALLQRESEVRRAWVITSEANTKTLHQMKRDLNAELLVLDLSPNECLLRIQRDPRRAGKAMLWKPLIERWWSTYSGRG